MSLFRLVGVVAAGQYQLKGARDHPHSVVSCRAADHFGAPTRGMQSRVWMALDSSSSSSSSTSNKHYPPRSDFVSLAPLLSSTSRYARRSCSCGVLQHLVSQDGSLREDVTGAEIIYL